MALTAQDPLLQALPEVLSLLSTGRGQTRVLAASSKANRSTPRRQLQSLVSLCVGRNFMVAPAPTPWPGSYSSLRLLISELH